jgi:hypothetical protein
MPLEPNNLVRQDRPQHDQQRANPANIGYQIAVMEKHQRYVEHQRDARTR